MQIAIVVLWLIFSVEHVKQISKFLTVAVPQVFRVWISVGGSIRNAFCSHLQDCRVSREPGRSRRDGMRTEKRVNEPGDSSGYESAAQTNMSLWREQEPEEQ